MNCYSESSDDFQEMNWQPDDVSDMMLEHFLIVAKHKLVAGEAESQTLSAFISFSRGLQVAIDPKAYDIDSIDEWLDDAISFACAKDADLPSLVPLLETARVDVSVRALSRQLSKLKIAWGDVGET